MRKLRLGWPFRKYAALLLPALGVAAAAACSSSSSDPGTTPGIDAGGADATATDSSTSQDTSVPLDAAPEAATDASCGPYTGPIPNDAGAQCHDLVNSATRLPVTIDPGAMPVGTGGPPPGDGLYQMTEVRTYPGSPVPANITFKYTVLLVGDLSYTVQDNSNEAATVRNIVKKNPDGGAGLVLCSTKVDNGGPETSHTSTCSSLTTYDANSLFSAKLIKQ